MFQFLRKRRVLSLSFILLLFTSSFAQLDNRFGAVGKEGALHLGNSGLQWYRDWQNSYLPENYPPPGKNKIWTVGKIDYRSDNLGMDYRWLILDLLENTDANFLESFLDLSLAIVNKIFSPLLNGYWQDNIPAIEDSLETIVNEQVVTEMVLRVKHRATFKNTKISFPQQLPAFQMSAADSTIQLSAEIPVDWSTHIYVEAWVLNPNPFHWGYIWKDLGDADGTFHTKLKILAEIGVHGLGRERRLQLDTLRVDATTESEIDWSALGIDFTWETLSNTVENLIDSELENSLIALMDNDSLTQPYYLIEVFKSLFSNDQVPTQQEILDKIFEYEKPFIRSLIRPGDFIKQYWSVGYEPNFFPYMRPEQYAAYFTKYYRYIKSFDEDAKILGPSILLTDLMENPEEIVFSYIPPMLWGFITGVEDEFAQLIKSYFQKTDCQSWYRQFLDALPPDINIDIIDMHVFPLATRFQDINWDSVSIKINNFASFAHQLNQGQEIWVTEFGNIDYRRSEYEAVAICQNLSDYFKNNSVGIKKWFWYLSIGHSPFYDTDFSPDPPISALLNTDLSLTRIGKAYLKKADNTPPLMSEAPEDGGTSVAANNLIFTWKEAIEKDTGIENYQVQVKVKDDEIIGYENWVGKKLFARITGFIGKTVIARVRAKNGAGLIGDWSPWSDGVTVLPTKKTPIDTSKLADDLPNRENVGNEKQADNAQARIEADGEKDALNSARAIFQILKNYPNPFNSSTTIEYQLSRSMDVKVTIFNSIGQEIKILVNQYQSAGTHSVQWDGFDSFGNPAVSGVYFFQIDSGGIHQIRKITLLR